MSAGENGALSLAGILTKNPDTGAFELSESDIEAFGNDVKTLVKNGTAASPQLTHIIPGVPQTWIPLEIPPMPSAVEAIESGEPNTTTSFADSYGNFLVSVAEFLNIAIDSPVASKIPPTAGPIVDPTIIIKKIKFEIEEVIKQITDLVKEKLSEFREHLGDNIQGFLDKLTFEFDELGISEILEKLIAAIAIIATMLTAPPASVKEGINSLLDLFGIPAVGDIIQSIINIIFEIQNTVQNLDLGSRIRNKIVDALAEVVVFIQQQIKEQIQDKIAELILSFFNLPLPSLPQLPDFIVNLPEMFVEFFNLEPPIIDFNLMPTNVLSEILSFFTAILEFFKSQVPTLDFVMSLITAILQGAPGLIEFLIKIVTSIFESAFNLDDGAVLKIASIIIMINRTVKYLAIALVGYLLGDGLIFEWLVGVILGNIELDA